MSFKELKVFLIKPQLISKLLVAPACLHAASDGPCTSSHPRCFCLTYRVNDQLSEWLDYRKRIAQLPEQSFPRKSDVFPFTRLVVTFCLLEMLYILDLVRSFIKMKLYVADMFI